MCFSATGSARLSTNSATVEVLGHHNSSPPPLLALPEGMPNVVERDDSSLLKALIDYQQDQRHRLLDHGDNHKEDPIGTADIVTKVARAAECALIVLDRMPRPTAGQYLMVLNAWNYASAATVATSLQNQYKGIPQRAELVVQKLKQRNLPLTIQEYNCVLKLWANSKEYLRGSFCERFFNQSFASSQSNQDSASIEPDASSYRWIVQAWCQSKETEAAYRATDYLLMWRANDVDPPQLEDYHLVLETWARSTSKKKAIRAWQVVQSMLEWDKDQTKLVRPDRTCYRYCLNALSTSFLPELGQFADDILQHMSDRYILPDTDCYSFAIRTWRNTAILAGDPQLLYAAATRASALLDDMSTAYHRSSLVVVFPCTKHCNDVLHAWHAAAARHNYVVDKADELLTKMEQAADSNLLPDVHSYRLVLDTLAKQKQPSGMSKLKRAEDILQRMKKYVGVPLSQLTDEADQQKEEVDADKEDVELSKTAIAVYNAFLRVLASIKVRNDSDLVQILRRAFEVLDEMETDPNLELHSATYLAFLDVVANVTGPGSKECSYSAERVFQKCCRQGLLNKFVLKSFQSLVPEEVFHRLVLDRCTRDATDHKWLVPQAWTRHSPLPMIHTEQGRRQMPLSVEGKYVVPPEALDYKARNLRQRRGQNLLQGGRLIKK